MAEHSIEEFNSLIKSIITATGLDEKQISKAVSRNEGYISQTRSRGIVPQKLVDLLELKFKQEFQKNWLRIYPGFTE